MRDRASSPVPMNLGARFFKYHRWSGEKGHDPHPTNFTSWQTSDEARSSVLMPRGLSHLYLLHQDQLYCAPQGRCRAYYPECCCWQGGRDSSPTVMTLESALLTVSDGERQGSGGHHPCTQPTSGHMSRGISSPIPMPLELAHPCLCH